ncbi:receptor-like protein 43 isoform X2 [Nymphaea colorata]|uniref:receptor-like protein 43 isoform X2 n=1 Tax=Nymphaea colorata TaxID=210225 RepID=UPI00214E9963|nr:receptor-like protein 43 isoform X2 [Nymphaea colorata]
MGEGAAAIARPPNPLLLCRSTIIFLGMFVIGVVCASKDETPPPPTSTETSGAVSRICLANQSSALLQFKRSLLEMQPDVLSSWQHNGSDCCHWKGVTCNNLTGFVIALEIPFHDLGLYGYDQDIYLKGVAIDSSLFKLPYLQRLDLSYNLLNGIIPKRLVELTHLTHLNLSHCEFSGQIPVELSQMTRLVSLDLSYNPRLLLQHPNFLQLFRGFVHLEHLRLDRADVSMSLREVSMTLSSSQELQTISLSGCNISGTMDESLLHFQSLSYLDLGSNKLESKLSNNNIEGEIPSCLWWELSSFDALVLDHNKLHGFEEPAHRISLAADGGLLYMSVSNNPIEGEIPTFLCDVAPTFLDMSENSLMGEIPDCLGKQVTVLNLRKNQLGGQIPDGFESGLLEFVALSDNLLTGKIPRSLFNRSSLRVLDLGNNKLNDSFPSQLGQLPKLQVLILRSNHLHGPITVDASQQEFHWLKIFDISNNYFSGSLPHELFQGFKAMMSGTKENEIEFFEIGLTFLSGYWERDVDHFVEETIKGEYRLHKEFKRDLTIIDLSSNNFTGRIPEEIGSLTSLYILNISTNHLVGSIPESFGKLQQMESLDLSYNQLSGVIPGDLSYNDSHGMIPQGNQFNTFPASPFKPASPFEGNPMLCGLMVNRSCPHAGGDGLVEKKNKQIKEKGWKYGSVEFGFAVGLVITTLSFLFMNRVTDWYWDRTDRMIDFILQRVFPSRFGRRRH